MSDPGERLARAIADDGPLPFARFMEQALYGEGGYYARSRPAIGEAGDFVTGSSVSPLFARATHRLLERLDRALDEPAALLEIGYGTGEHLARVARLAGGERRVLGWDRVPRPVEPADPEAASPEILRDLEAVGRRGLTGLIFAYEVFDALAVHRLVGLEDGGVGELLVDRRGGEFAWRTGELSSPELEELLGDERLAPGQVADLAPGWGPLMQRLADLLDRGLLVVFDYGFERRRLLDVRVRRHGTLACYRSHRVHRNPFVAVGEQDLTAHVDFTALVESAEAAGLERVSLSRQALWLTACGLFDDLAGADEAVRRQAMQLLDGAGMGEELRVLVLSRGVDPAALLDLGILR